MKNLIFIVWAAMIIPSAYAERVTAPEGKTYVYKETNGVSRELEIYFPKTKQGSKKPVPGIIMFHGGGWGGGTRDQFRYLCHYFASRGLVTATVTYKLAPKARPEEAKSTESRKRVCPTRRVPFVGTSRILMSWVLIPSVLSRVVARPAGISACWRQPPRT